MASDGNPRASNGGMMSSLRRLIGGGKHDEAPGTGASGPDKDTDADELVLGGRVGPKVIYRRVSGIEEDDGGGDALVLGPAKQEAAPDRRAEDQTGGDLASEGPRGDGATSAKEGIDEPAGEAEAEAIGETADVTADEYGDEYGDRPGDETAEDEAVGGDDGAGADEAVAAAGDKHSWSHDDKFDDAPEVAPVEMVGADRDGDVVREGDVIADDMAAEARDMGEPEAGEPDTDSPDVDDADVDDGGSIGGPQATAVEMSAIFSGLAVDEDVDYGGEPLPEAMQRLIGDGAAGGSTAPRESGADQAGGPGLVAMPDPRELEDNIRRVIREELTGEMGQRLSKNIQRLIRNEIARALQSRG
jgi:hypothetical protein